MVDCGKTNEKGAAVTAVGTDVEAGRVVEAKEKLDDEGVTLV